MENVKPVKGGPFANSDALIKGFFTDAENFIDSINKEGDNEN